MSVEAPLNKAIGQKLRSLREERRMPREQLALALEMSSENLRNYEAGKQKLTLAMLPAIAETYGMALPALLSELFDLEGEPGHTLSSNGKGSPNNGIANYVWTESLDGDSCRRAPRPHPSRPSATPTRELVAAGR